MSEHRALDRVASLIREVGPTGKVGVLTGAGISVPSGIPDFRSPGGIWEEYPPHEYATIDAFEANPIRVWGLLEKLDAICAGAEPNAAHVALARLEASGHLGGIVTQNVDGLHQRAGSERVIEFHGSGERLVCLRCKTRRPTAKARATEEMPPRCPSCDAIEKPDVVLFGEMIPPEALAASEALLERCELWLVVGTSAQVHPAASIPMTARSRGIYVCELNLETSLHAAEVRLLGDVVETLPALADAVT